MSINDITPTITKYNNPKTPGKTELHLVRGGGGILSSLQINDVREAENAGSIPATATWPLFAEGINDVPAYLLV